MKKPDYAKGFYYLFGGTRADKESYCLVYRQSLTGNSFMSADDEIAWCVTFREIKDAIRKQKIRRVIWLHDSSGWSTVKAKDIVDGKFLGMMVV